MFCFFIISKLSQLLLLFGWHSNGLGFIVLFGLINVVDVTSVFTNLWIFRLFSSIALLSNIFIVSLFSINGIFNLFLNISIG